MNKKDFAMLCINYGKEPNEELYELWKTNLKDYEDAEIKKAINTIIANDKYFPTFNRIISILKKVEPEWINKNTFEEIDEETKAVFDDFQQFLEEFRNANF